jgi:riboflavin synthase
MFTGIIEATGTITAVEPNSGNKTFWLESPLSTQLRVDQSVSHNGVCLTVEEVRGNSHRITAIRETLLKSNLNGWEVGKIVNLERSLRLDSRLDGHLVQGHVDTTAECIGVKETEGSWQYSFKVPMEYSSLIIEKGSISLNGISLTIFNVGENTFEVAIIPYTYDHTNMNEVVATSRVNIEFDLIGKYVERFSKQKMKY